MMTNYDWLMKLRLGVALQSDVYAEMGRSEARLTIEEFEALCERARLAGEIVTQGREKAPPYLWPSWFKEPRL